MLPANNRQGSFRLKPGQSWQSLAIERSQCRTKQSGRSRSTSQASFSRYPSTGNHSIFRTKRWENQSKTGVI
jgi:hypothetical protein